MPLAGFFRSLRCVTRSTIAHVSWRTDYPLLAIWLLIGCDGGSSGVPEANRRDSAGVVIVENTGEDRVLPWSYEVSFRLGGDPEGPEQFYQVDESQVATDTSGNIYVLDRQNHRVVRFDRTGHVHWTAGRQGGGPGELMRPGRIRVDDAGTTYVIDYGKDALVQYDSSGHSVRQMPIGSLDDVIPARDWVFGHRRDYLEGGGVIEQLVAIDGSDTTVVLRTPSVPTSRYRIDACGFPVGLVGPVIFGKETRWAVASDELVVSSEVGYTVDFWRAPSSAPARSVRRSLPTRAATHDLALQWAQITKPHRVFRSSDGSSCVPPAGEVVEKRGIADSLPAIEQVRIDRAGRLWVQRFAIESSQAPIDVFAADGLYLGTLPPDYPWPGAFAAPDRILFVEQDEMDIQRLVVAEVVTDGRGIPMGSPSN